MQIKNMRKQKGLLQKYVANKLGISTRHYQRIEKGQQKPSENQLRILAETFMCDVSKICDGKEKV